VVNLSARPPSAFNLSRELADARRGEIEFQIGQRHFITHLSWTMTTDSKSSDICHKASFGGMNQSTIITILMILWLCWETKTVLDRHDHSMSPETGLTMCDRIRQELTKPPAKRKRSNRMIGGLLQYGIYRYFGKNEMIPLSLAWKLTFYSSTLARLSNSFGNLPK
jgi:hypothetical protein